MQCKCNANKLTKKALCAIIIVMKGVDFMSMKSITLRVDEDVKKRAEEIFSEIGVPFATAVGIFLKKAVNDGGFPFDLKVNVPNHETIEAMQEADRMSRDPHAKRYNDFDEILTEVHAEIRAEGQREA